MRFAAPILLSLLVIGFLWKLALTGEFLWMDSPDLANQVLPWFQFQAGELHAGRIPLWDPYQWCGQPLLGQMQPGTAYPLNWILFLAPLRHGWIRQAALNWYFIAIHLIAAWMAYWLCRDRGLRFSAAIFAGLAFSLSGWVGSTGWPQMLNGAVWAPAVFLFLFRAVEGKRPMASSLLSGFFLGLAWLSGHHQAPIFLTLGALVIWFYWLLIRKRNVFDTFIYHLIFLLSFGLTSALQVIPAIEYGRLSLRWAGGSQPVRWGENVPYIVHQALSLTPAGVLGIVTPTPEESVNAFCGVTMLALALLGVVGCWGKAWVRLVTLVTIFGFVVALGTYTPLHGILYALVPAVEKARSAFVSIFIFNFGSAILAACGIESLLDRGGNGVERRAGILLLLVAATGGAVLLLAQVIGKLQISQGLGATVLASIAVGSLLLAWNAQAISRGTLVWGLVAAMLAELTVGGLIAGLPSRHAPNRNFVLDPLARLSGVAAFLRTQPRPFRMATNDKDVPFNFGDWYGIETTGGYLASLTGNISEAGVHSPPVSLLAGARYYLGRSPQRDNQRLVFADPSGLNLYEDPDAFPRAWAVHEIVEADTRLEVIHLMSNKKEILRSTAPTTARGIALQKCAASDRVEVLENRPGRTVLEAELGCRGMVVLSEVFFPGWRATVDGRDMPIHEVYGFLRGVVVEGGRHRVEMDYRPRSVFAGAAMTLAGTGLALGTALSGLRRRKSAILTS
jgi:hypothetical protein